MTGDDEITPKILLVHMHGMEKRLTARIFSVEEKLTHEIDGLSQDLRMTRISLTQQIDAIDHRLDAIEIENLPKRVKRLEAKLR